MIKFPVLNWLRIDDYALYPGKSAEPGLFADFTTNLSLVVGANGLGKSTLLTVAFRMLTGPFDIPGAARSGELGSARLTVSPLRTNGEFAARVSDGATRAQAAIAFALGSDEFVVVRALQNQRLISWSLNGEVKEPREADLQGEIASSCGVYSFADWILVLRYVTFYMDDRQVLFWDHSAQKQLLRSLFLPPAEAKEWVNRERRVLEIDSTHRNRRAALTQAKRDLARQVDPSSDNHASLRARLLQLLNESETAAALAESALAELSILEGELATANLDRLRAEVEADKVFKSYEQSKMHVLAEAFPSVADSARFIWSQLLAEGLCLTCGSHVPALAEEIESRIGASLCAVCGSPMGEDIEASDLAGAAMWSTVQASRAAVREAERQYQELGSRVSEARRSVARLDREREDREHQIDSVNARLPTSDEAYLKHRSQVSVFESLLESAAVELEDAAADFETFVAARGTEILEVAGQLKLNFERYARSFLLDEGELAWSAREETIGQSKYKVAFPAYELRLRRNDGGNVSTRSGPGDVSESQKEFIDLAFRMALVHVAGVEAAATILIDTPESSLDAVFSSKAASVLSDFVSGASKSHIIVASNLTDGPLIPALVRSVKAATGDVSVLNLLELARPTPAIQQLGDEYQDAYQRLLTDAGLVGE